MQLLLDGGADKDLANDRRETPLWVAASSLTLHKSV